jgi:catechol 2,3-dioxygenase-like lactoylglutathione lyase family enzyme
MPNFDTPNLDTPNFNTPNIENLKKQAKQYLRWHRERYYPVAARIRAGLPRFRHLSDAQVLDANFKLADAQELVARERGFEGWQALKSGAYTMPHKDKTQEAGPTAQRPRRKLKKSFRRTQLPSAGEAGTEFAALTGRLEAAPLQTTNEIRVSQQPASPILSSTEAQLFVADIQASCDFYIEKLGFTVAFVYGDPPFYGQVTRDHARLNLRMVCEPVFVGDIREREHLLSATLTVATADEIKQLFLNYQAAGVRFQRTLKKEPWGARTFIVQDPDGNLILFAGPAD